MKTKEQIEKRINKLQEGINYVQNEENFEIKRTITFMNTLMIEVLDWVLDEEE